MRWRSRRGLLLVGVMGAVILPAATPSPAAAFSPLKHLCGAIGFVSGALGKVCSVAQNAGRALTAGKKLLSGHLGGAAKTFLGEGGRAIASKAGTALALAALGTWVIGGTKFALLQTAHVLSTTTTPQLGSVWFSATYWRVAGIAALLTLPFLFAAAIQAIIASDLALLIRAALGYLPLAGLAVAIAAPVTMLLLSASDELSSIVASAGDHSGGHFLARAGAALVGLTAGGHSPFLVFLAGLLTVGAALVLWLELLMRSSAVYVIVLMLPLAFAAMVWPARRIWAVRAVELLIALILSKFAIVAVLSLGGAAISGSVLHSPTGIVAGMTLLALGICAPWALMRLLPMAELAGGVAGALRGDVAVAYAQARGAYHTSAQASREEDWAPGATAHMRREGEALEGGLPTAGSGEPTGAEHGADDLRADGRGAADQSPPAESQEQAEPTRPIGPSGPTPGPQATPEAAAGAPARAATASERPAPWEAEDLTLEPLVLDLDNNWDRWGAPEPRPEVPEPPEPQPFIEPSDPPEGPA